MTAQARWGLVGSIMLAGCPPAPEANRGPVVPPLVATTSAAATASVGLPPTALPVAAPSLAPIPEAPFEIVLEQRTLHQGGDAMSFVHLLVAEGVLVVASPPPKAVIVSGAMVKELPDFFRGLRSPAPDWPPGEFMVSSLEGTLQRLRFRIYAPATEYQDEVDGAPGRWKTRSGRRAGAKAAQPDWVTERAISLPFTTATGARFIEEAAEYQSPASKGFAFRFLGPSKGASLPRPAPGTKGCRFALLGHPVLHLLADGTVMGFGTLCTSGADSISTAKLQGVAPPFQSIGPRLGTGQLASEHWLADGTSVVQPLPRIPQLAEFAGFDLVTAKTGELYLVTQRNPRVPGTASADGPSSQAYVALFDGMSWHDVTPSDPPELFVPHQSPDGDLYLLHPRSSWRRSGAGSWERLALELRRDDCDDAWMSDVGQAPSGDWFISAAPACLWRVRHRTLRGERMVLPNQLSARKMVPHQGELYLFAGDSTGDALLRLVR